MQTNALPSTEPQTPAISALADPVPPTPTEQLAEAQKVIIGLRQENETKDRRIELLESDLGVACERLRAHEESPLTLALNTIDHGGLLDDAGVALNALMSTVLERGKKGALAIVFTLKPLSEAQFSMDAVVKVTEPQKEKPMSTFFIGPDGKISRNDPRQRQLPLK